jgi:hypothetical protein
MKINTEVSFLKQGKSFAYSIKERIAQLITGKPGENRYNVAERTQMHTIVSHSTYMPKNLSAVIL